MITVFNRKEVFLTYSMKTQAEVRSLLSANQIAYSVKVVDRTNPSPFSADMRGRTGTLGQNPQLSYEYIFYVHKDDFEKANALIRGNIR